MQPKVDLAVEDNAGFLAFVGVRFVAAGLALGKNQLMVTPSARLISYKTVIEDVEMLRST